MKILISHVYSSSNNGDAAILSAQIDELKRTFNNPAINVLSVDKIEPNYKFDGVPVFNSLMYWAISGKKSKLNKLLRSFTMMSYTLIWTLMYRLSKIQLPLHRDWRKPMQLLIEADMQVCVGGGYLRTKKDHISTVILLLLLHQIWLAKVLNKPVYMYAQSFGPFPTKTQLKLAKFGLKQADLILVREARSRKLLNTMGIDDQRVVKVPDSAFMFSPPRSLDTTKLFGPKKPSDRLVGVTVRNWLNPKEQNLYERAMASFIDKISREKDLKVAVIAQVTSEHHNDDDRVVGERIKKLLGHNNNVTFLNKRFNHYEIKSIFANLSYLVGTRFHSVIFALTDEVPAIAIEYEHKTSGIMQDLGLEKWVIDINDVTAERLEALFKLLVKERSVYVRHLHKVLPAYIDKAYETGQIIKQAYEQSFSSGGAVGPEEQK